jgi:thioredoxin-like negative regulator of GroEL
MSRTASSRSRDSLKPLLVFFSAQQCGPARRMESLIAQLARKERDRLRIARVDVEEDVATAQRFRVREVPTLVLVKGRRTIARFEGRAKAADIQELVEPHLPGGKTDRNLRS